MSIFQETATYYSPQHFLGSSHGGPGMLGVSCPSCLLLGVRLYHSNLITAIYQTLNETDPVPQMAGHYYTVEQSQSPSLTQDKTWLLGSCISTWDSIN